MRQSIGHRGRRISYLDSGTAADADHGTLVLLHAFPMAAEMWQPQLDAVPAGWRFIAPDLRGFGHSDPSAFPAFPGQTDDASTRVSLDENAEDVLALMDALGLDRVALGGVSMGGYAAFAVVRREPQRVAALLLADTRAEADTDAARASRDAMLEVLARGGPPAVVEGMLPALLGETTRAIRPQLVDRVRAIGRSQSPTGIAHAIRRLKTRPDSTPLLERLKVPVLVVVGQEDRITTPDVARQLHEGIAGSRLAIIPEAGHLSSLEQPEAFNRTLTEFLTAIGG